MALLFFLGAAVYANSLQVPFFLDDTALITGSSRHLSVLWPPWKAFYTIRPLVDYSLAINFALGGLDAAGYHLFNIAVHLLASLALFGTCLRILNLPSLPEKFKKSSYSLSLAIATLWLVHPLNTESVTYVIQRAESMAGLFYLLTFYCYLRSKTPQARTKIWVSLSVLSCGLGMATKATLASAPFLILLFDGIFISGSLKATLRNNKKYYVALFLTFIVLLISYGVPRFFHWFTAIAPSYDYSPWVYLENQTWVFWNYLRLSLIPYPLCIDYFYNALPHGQLIAPCAAALAFLSLVLVSIKFRPKTSFLGIWLFLTLAPTSSLFPVSDLMVEHRMYIPLMAVIAAFVLGFFHSISLLPSSTERFSRRLASSVAILLVFSYAVLSVQRNEIYIDQQKLWKEALQTNPANFRAANNVAEELVKKGKWKEALPYLYRAVESNPTAKKLLLDVSEEIVPPASLPKYAGTHQAFKERFFAAFTFAQLGRIYYFFKMDNPKAAHFFYSAVHANPWKSVHYSDLGSFMSSEGKFKEAETFYKMALQVDAGDESAKRNLEKLKEFLPVTAG